MRTRMRLYFLVSLCIAAHMEAAAQAISVGEAVEIVYPGLTVSVVREQPRTVNGQDVCTLQGTLWECGASPQADLARGGFTIGVDAAGSVYHLAVNGQSQQIDFGGGRSGFLLQRITAAGQTETLARLLVAICLDQACSQNKQFGGLHPTLDVTNGRIVVAVVAILVVGITPNPINVGVVQIDGLPKMFDTLLTFTPNGQTLSMVTPAHPDGFRSADSLQVWTGDLGTLPDWSLAQPLACDAATNPTPGQLVTVPDNLPNPPPGQGRYYVSSVTHDSLQRLGRQFISGAFIARDPASLPLCGP